MSPSLQQLHLGGGKGAEPGEGGHPVHPSRPGSPLSLPTAPVPVGGCDVTRGKSSETHTMPQGRKGKGPQNDHTQDLEKEKLKSQEEREGVAPKAGEGRPGSGDARFQQRPQGGARGQRAKVCAPPGLGGGAACGVPLSTPPRCAFGPSITPDPGWPALAPGRAGPTWTGIDRHPDKSIDLCTGKLIDLLAPWARERPAGEAGTRGS